MPWDFILCTNVHHGICSCLFCVIHAFPSSEGRMVYRNGSGICNPAISCCLRSYGLEGHSVCSSCAGVYHIAVEASEWREMAACCIVCIKWGDDVPVPLEWLVRILGMCSNFLCFFLEKEPESDRTSGGFLLAAVVVKYPVMNGCRVTPPDFVESLCIPIQQISYVLANDRELSLEQLELIDAVIDRNYVKNLYNPEFADNMKELVRAGHPEYLEAHKRIFQVMA